MAIHSQIVLHCLCVFLCYIVISNQDVAKLPFCNEEVVHSEFILVSTLDGVFTALKPTGDVAWQIETGPGPLLSSNIHTLELTNNAHWVRIIPSLSGNLYKFDSKTIDPIPVSADTLLRSSFRYSDDLLIAGGREVRTYGVLLNSGEPLYECSLDGCKNTTDYSDNMEDVIVIERKTHTVRAVDPRTGGERWNFSVGQHNIKVPFMNCFSGNPKTLLDFNVTAVLPEGLLVARRTDKSAEVLWQHKFEAPIVAVWKWNGRDIISLNLFSTSTAVNTKSDTNMPSLYVGMHNKQLYVQESIKMQNILQLKQYPNENSAVVESKSLTQIPWKPVRAVGMAISNAVNNIESDADDSTALSVLYASEYVNGNGYYLYTEDKMICESNTTNAPTHKRNAGTILYWWKEVFVVALTTVIICNVMYNYRLLGFRAKHQEKSEASISPPYLTRHSSSSYSESSETFYTSRYLSEFEPICCLGKGGFGVVFQAKKKFDECDYAIKRITLPNKPDAKDRMMREVKALAKLDHRNIVRYYNAWLESPPPNWEQENKQWLNEFSASCTESSLNTQGITNLEESSLAINVESAFLPAKIDTICERNKITSDSSSIVFQRSSTVSTALQDSTNTTNVLVSKNLYEQNLSNASFAVSCARVYLYIQMQLCCKESLKDWLNSNTNRDRLHALSIFQQIVEAVEYVHFRGLIHRDLKPGNIFFSLEGQIKVGDFGLVTSIKDYGDDETDLSSSSLQKSYTNAVGTHLYMSPEQLKGLQYDFKVDIYSLGIILFELLVPFATEMERITVLTDLRNHKYPQDFASVFQDEYRLLNLMLSADPEKRPTASTLRKIAVIE